jgi:hypothetical protein
MKDLRIVASGVVACAFCISISSTAYPYTDADAAGLASHIRTPQVLSVSVAVHSLQNRSELHSARSHGAGRMSDVDGF